MKQPKVGDVVSYRSLAGDLLDATVMSANGNGTLDVDVILPNNNRPWRREKAQFGVDKPGHTFPKATT